MTDLPQETQEWMNGIKKAWIEYRSSDKFQDSILSSTQAGYGGSGYSVELFPDGAFRILWDNQIGNLYDSEGKIFKIPQLSEEDWDADPDLIFFDNAEIEFDEKFEEWWENYPTQFLAYNQ